MKRREFITLAGAAVAASSTSLSGQELRPARLGYVWIGSEGSEHSTRDGMRQGLRELGYAEGRDFILEERYADSQLDRLPKIIAELVQLRVKSHSVAWQSSNARCNRRHIDDSDRGHNS